MNLLQLNNVTIKIADKLICDNFTQAFKGGEVWGILGRNGAGKTTLLHSLCLLRNIINGEVLIDNKSILNLTRKQIAQQVGIQLQNTEDPFPNTVLESVFDGRHPYSSNWQSQDPEDLIKVKEAIQIVGLSDLQDRKLDQLSGGERQRVALATLIAQDPNIFLLDEPNSHLDIHFQIELLTHFQQYSIKQQRLLIMSLHDINLAHQYCSHIILLNADGSVTSGTASEMLTEENLSYTYQHPIRKITDNDNHFFTPSY